MYTRTLKTKRHNDKNILSASLFFLGGRIEQRSMVPIESKPMKSDNSSSQSPTLSRSAVYLSQWPAQVLST